MKNLFIFLLLVACAVLFLHDKQQTGDLAKAQTLNDQLTQQLASYQTAYAQVQSSARQLSSQVATQAAIINRPAPPRPQSQSAFGSSQVQDSGSLDRPAYKN